MGAEMSFPDYPTPADGVAPIHWAGWYPPMPTKTPHKCPVCDGRGNVPAGFYNIDPYPQATGGAGNITLEGMCRTCNGAGVLWET